EGRSERLKRVVRLGALAERDLFDIWQYTFERWGEAQADAYLDPIDRGIRLLIDHPDSGAKRDEVRHGYRVMFVNHHAIYYLITPAAVRVVRILQERMDPRGRM